LRALRQAQDRPKRGNPSLITWLPIIIGLTVLYVPSMYDLFTGIWSSDEQMHGPNVLGRSHFDV
jgi:hypothetical protein